MNSASCVLVLLVLAALNVNVVDCLSPLTSLRLQTSNAQAVTSSHLNANTNTLDVNANANVNSREEDLEVTRQLIMAHFDKIDSCEDEDSEDSSFHACSSSKNKNKKELELELELATNILLQSLMSVKSCANRIQNTARIVTANISIHLDPLTRMNQVLIRKGRKAATATVSRAKIWDGATAGASFGSLLTMQFPSDVVTRVQLEKTGMKFVSVCSRILSLGQLEICFD